MAQGATTLASITSNLAGSDLLAKTLDREGRETALDIIEVSFWLTLNLP